MREGAAPVEALLALESAEHALLGMECLAATRGRTSWDLMGGTLDVIAAGYQGERQYFLRIGATYRRELTREEAVSHIASAKQLRVDARG